MERNTPVRKPHTSTADLLTWSEVPPSESPATVSGARSHQVPTFSLSQVKNVLLGLFTFTHRVCICLHSQPSDKISKVLHGGQLTDEEAQSLLKT